MRSREEISAENATKRLRGMKDDVQNLKQERDPEGRLDLIAVAMETAHATDSVTMTVEEPPVFRWNFGLWNEGTWS